MEIVTPYATMLDVKSYEDGIALLKKVEWCGRVSHRSEDAQTADSWERFIRSVVLGHGDWCYDEETEVLTDVGWKHWNTVVEQDRFATLNQHGHIEYHFPVRLFKSYYSGRMYYVNGRNVNLLVTPNHQMYVCLTTTKEGRKRQNFSFIRARDLDHTSHAYCKTGQYTANNLISYDEARFIGFAIGDAYIDTNTSHGSTIRFELKRERKKIYLREVCLKAGLIFTESESKKTGCTRFYVSAKNALQHYLLDIYDSNRQKQVPRSLLFAGKETCLGIIDGLINSDGSLSKKNLTRFDTTSQVLASTFQQLCLHAGKAADLTYVLAPNRIGAFPNAKALYHFDVLSSRHIKPEVNRWAGAHGKAQWVEWNGNVYCAEVPNHTLYVRRHGKAVWSGNSITEHASVTVDAVVDRGITHEWVRHRLGAYTQESTRFVNYEKKGGLRFIAPPGISCGDGSPWTVAVECCESAYFSLLHTGYAPQIARSVLPNSLASRLITTYNLRMWRHFLLMRTSRETHPQMREVTVPLLAEFRDRIPLLYDDIEPLAKQSENLRMAR